MQFFCMEGSMAKKYKVGFKTINAKLQVTREHLKRIKKHVVKGDQKKIDMQIEAINVIIADCKTAKMSATYTGSDD
jgi:hypothetical protein